MGLRSISRDDRQASEKFDAVLEEKMPGILAWLTSDVERKVVESVYELTRWAIGKVDPIVILRAKYKYLVTNWHIDRFAEDTEK